MLLGKGHKYLENSRYREALERVLKAREHNLERQFEMLSYMIGGKARIDLGDPEYALPALRRAAEIPETVRAEKGDKNHLLDPLQDIAEHIDAIERG